MSYFVTFYSYKGGVGRTLALANVAWLLANHPTEPARVLALDFDLGAPGLCQVLGFSKANKAEGIVDYVTNYLKEAAIPDVTQYIHKTTHRNIDIMPAGRMNSQYQRRLELIDWKAMYEGAFGYELIEKLKSDISALRPEYDYVLIDSLTGYSDVGGICVNQFPDTLTLLFRLNQQNLDGIGNVFRALKPRNGDEQSRSVIPVITPSWPFLDEAAGQWIDRAQRIFSGDKLLEISFDSSLSFGEKIISERASKLPFPSKVLADYKALSEQIRERNLTDPLTIWNSIRSGPPGMVLDLAEPYLRLLSRRPRVLEYWEYLPAALGFPLFLFKSKKSRSQALQKLLAFTDQEADAGNQYALLGRSIINSSTYGKKSSAPDKAKEDLDRALEIDPDFVEAHFARGRLLYEWEKYEDAISDFIACLKLRPKGYARAEYSLAEVYLRLSRAEEALDMIQRAIAHNPKDMDMYLIRAKARYLLGDYQSALADARMAAKANYVGFPGSFLPSQILAANGQVDEAAKELALMSEQIDKDGLANLAEAYLAVDPEMTIRLLQKSARQPEPAVRKVLLILARIFRGDELSTIAAEVAAPVEKPVTIDDWDFFEVTAILRAREREGSLSPKAIELARKAIQKAMTTQETAKTKGRKPQ
jgi:tetratricopeptide (TPR) repeat protein